MRMTAVREVQERRRVLVEKITGLSGGYRDNDPPLTYYQMRGIAPPERVTNSWIIKEAIEKMSCLKPAKTVTNSKMLQQVLAPNKSEQSFRRKNTEVEKTEPPSENDPAESFDPTENRSQSREEESAKAVLEKAEKKEPNRQHFSAKQLNFERKQLQSAPASTNKVASQNSFQTVAFKENRRPKTAVAKKTRQNRTSRKSVTGGSNLRPQTTGSRVFASQMTNMSEKEQGFVVKRMQCRSAQMKRFAESRDVMNDQSRCRSAKSAAARSGSRDRLISLVRGSVGSHVSHEVEMKRLMTEVCRDYYKQLKTDVRSFIVDTYSV